MSDRRHTYTPPTEQNWADVARWTGMQNTSPFAAIIMDLDSRLAAIERERKPVGYHDVDEFYRDEPPASPPTPQAGKVESANVFCASLVGYNSNERERMIAARDAAIAAAARESERERIIRYLADEMFALSERDLATIRTPTEAAR